MTCKDCEIKEGAFQAISTDKKRKKIKQIEIKEYFRKMLRQYIQRSFNIKIIEKRRKIKEVFIKTYRFKSKRIEIVNNETQTP